MQDGTAAMIQGTLCACVIVGPIVGAMVAGVLGRPVGRSMLLGFLGPVGWLLIGFLEREYEKHCDQCGGGLPDPPRKRCPHCGELLSPPATPPPPPRAPLTERPAVADDELLDLLGKPTKR